MDLTHFTPCLADDLTVVVDGAETIQIYLPDSGVLLTVSHCVGKTTKANKTPTDSPQGATILEREWNCPVAPMSRQKMEGGNETTNGSGVTQFAEGEPNTLNSASSSPNGECVIPFASLTSLPPSNHSRLASINDIIIDSQDQQWRIVSIERKTRIGRVVYKAQRIDDQPRLDEWVDILTPIYQTDDNGAPYVQKYRADATGVAVRIIRVPVSSHRQLTDVPEERIEIVFADNNLRIGAHQRIRLSDGTIYKPTDLFPITQTRPALRIIAQREAVGSRQ